MQLCYSIFIPIILTPTLYEDLTDEEEEAGGGHPVHLPFPPGAGGIGRGKFAKTLK